MTKRSPILGYNHNVRYAGRLWHVQTEDSGVSNPHIFTHLFHDGTILATKRVDYDPTLEIPGVQKLMQSQHKTMLRELKAGAFDEKIGKFFGQPVVRDAEDTTDPGANVPGDEELAADMSPLRGSRTEPSLPILPEAAPAAAPPSASQPPPVPAQARSSPPRVGSAGSIPRVSGIGGRRSTPAAGVPARPAAEGVVVARPAVIIGGDQTRRDNTQPRISGQPIQTKRWHAPSSQSLPTAAAPAKPPPSDNIFGGDLISEKSLDEVILAYLSEDMSDK